MCWFWDLFCRLEGKRGVAILTLCMFRIQCAWVHGLAFVFISFMFHALCGRVCVGRMKVTIANMLCICYHQGPIILAVCAAFFTFIAQGSHWFSPSPPFCCCCIVFPSPIEIMDHIEVSRLICCWLLKMSTLVITFIPYEERWIVFNMLILEGSGISRRFKAILTDECTILS